VLFVSRFLLASALIFLSLCFITQFYRQLCFLSRISCLFPSSSIFISGRTETKTMRKEVNRQGTKARNRKQRAHCRWAFRKNISGKISNL